MNPADAMAKDLKKRPLSRGRKVFRRCRQLALVCLLLFVGAVIYLNLVGLPDFIKDPVITRLRERGVDAQFSRLRWRWHQGLVAEDLLVRRTGEASGPQFSSDEAALRVDLGSLLTLGWRLDSAAFRQGQFSWVLNTTNGSPLVLDGIETELKFLPDGSLFLQNFSSRFRDLRLQISGTLANPEALAMQRKAPTATRTVAQLNDTMTQVANYLTNFTFTAQPALHLNFDADAAHWNSLTADIRFRLPDLRSTWGVASNFHLLAQIRPSATNVASSGTVLLSGDMIDSPWGRMEQWTARTRTVPLLQLPLNSSNEVTFGFARLSTPWGDVEQGRMEVALEAFDMSRPNELKARLQLGGDRFVAPQGRAGRVSLTSDAVVLRDNFRPVSGTHVVELHDVQQSTNATATRLHATIRQQPTAPTRSVVADETWGFWRHLEPFAFDFELLGEGVAARGVTVDQATISGRWAAPGLELNRIAASLYQGTLSGRLNVDVPTGQIEAAVTSDFNYHALDHVFTERFYNWFEPYQWNNAPHAEISGRVTWPDWRDFTPNWREEVAATLGISGNFHVNDASYRGIAAREAYSHFYFTNLVWNLPNLTIVRPEGKTVAVYDGDERTKDYVWHITADINPHALKPLFKEGQLRVFDSFTNHLTPHVEGTIRGRWRAHELISFRADVTAPRVEIRGEQTDLIAASVSYTNKLITIQDLEILQSNRVGRAEALGLDLPNQVMYFTNVSSVLPPMTIARAIGPVTARAVEPYQFTDAPAVHLNGQLGLKGHEKTDMVFDIDGEAFHWWRFNLETIQGRLHWQVNHLTLTNIVAGFYGGGAVGGGNFNFFTNRPTEFSFTTSVTNADFQTLVRDVFVNTNHLEGSFSGHLETTSARADSLDTWQGHGDLSLHDGLVWDIPLFGLFSPVLNVISPGLGQSRADRAGATFAIVNGTIISRDLEIESAQLSMKYEGSVDFESNVNAIMQARILRDSGVLGPLISTALWPLSKIFEYRLSGTLAEPQAEPVFIPKLLFLALEPFKALQGILKREPPPEFLPPLPP